MHKLITPQSTIYTNPSLNFYIKKRKGIFVQMAATFRKQLAEHKLALKGNESTLSATGLGSANGTSPNPPKTIFDKL
jgi:hypothetical protein